MPQPIDPNSHSPRNSGVPTATSSAANRTAPIASPMRAAARLIASAISPNSAFASSMWASIRRLPASRVAPICSPRPGASGSGGGTEPAASPAADAPVPGVDPVAGSASGGVDGLGFSSRVGSRFGRSWDRGHDTAPTADEPLPRTLVDLAATLRPATRQGVGQAAEPNARRPSRSAASKNPYARRKTGSTRSGRWPDAVCQTDRSSSSRRPESSAGPRGAAMSA